MSILFSFASVDVTYVNHAEKKIDGSKTAFPIAGGCRGIRADAGGDGQYNATRYPRNRSPYKHNGIDWAAPDGTVVVAPWDGGTVITAKRNVPVIGHLVEIEYSGNVKLVRFGHLSEIFVSKGQEVDSGTPIGKSGTSGNQNNNCDQHGFRRICHLHISFHSTLNYRDIRSRVNPHEYFNCRSYSKNSNTKVPQGAQKCETETNCP